MGDARHAHEEAPLSAAEREELERLRAEKAVLERRELERLRAERRQAAGPPGAPAPVSAGTQAEREEARRIAEARRRGERLMVPDEESLAMPPGQKIVLGVIALAVLVAVALLMLP